MDIFGAFSNAVRGFIAAGPNINADQRKMILEIVGELRDTLDDSLSLTIIYLSHTKHARDQEFSRHLADGRMKLGESFREFKICGGLYNLRDRFRQMFSPTWASVNLRRIQEIEYLVNDLAHGERTVIDYLSELTDWMAKESDGLSKLSVGTKVWKKQRDRICAEIDSHITNLREKQKTLTKETRHLIDRM